MRGLLSKNDYKAIRSALIRKERIIIERSLGDLFVQVETVELKKSSVWGQDMIVRVKTKQKNMTTTQNFRNVEEMQAYV